MKELIRAVSKELKVDRNEAELVIAALMDRPRFELYMKNTLEADEKTILWARVMQLKNGMPIEYVTKRVQFQDSTLKILPGVFIPRVETEYFVEMIPKIVPQRPERILEIGTGCGAISIALAQLYPEARILATDISSRAIENAYHNIKELRLESRISLLQCNLYESVKGEFDLIVSNPPYVPHARMGQLPRSVREFEPLMALDGGEQGIQFIEKLIVQGMNYLTEKGFMAVEIDEESVKLLKEFLASRNIQSFVFRKDLFNKYRFLFIGASHEES
jgi:release factor glutamine methyltransferase